MANMPNAPLVYMISMVRFPKVPELGRFIPGFHDAVRSEYPLEAEIVAHGVSTHVDPGGVRFEQVETKLWQFAAPDKSFAFLLGEEFLGLHTASYRDHQDFARRFEVGLRALLGVPGIGIGWVLSVGIRYIDLVVPQPGEELSQYLQKQVLPMESLPGEELAELLESSSVAAYQTRFGALRVQILRNPPTTIAPELDTPFVAGNGWKRVRPNGTFAVLDIDHGARFEPPMAMDASSIIRRMVELRGATNNSFRSLATDFALRVWESPA